MGFFFALVISILLEPAIKLLQKIRIPRGLSVTIIYVSVFLISAVLVYYSSSIFISELLEFSYVLPDYLEKISPPFKAIGIEAFESTEKFLSTIEGATEKMAGSIFGALSSFFGGVLSTVFVVTIALFVSLEENPISKIIALLVPRKHEDFAFSLFQRSQEKISGWFISRIIACFFVGLASFLVLMLFEVDYPFTLALLAAGLEFLPTVGPILTAAIVFLIVIVDSTSRAIFILIAFTLIQQIESNILTPILTKKFVKVPAVLVLLALAIGGKLWGILGAILSVPLVGILFEFFKDFLRTRKEEL